MEYLFKFLDAYDFATDGTEGIEDAAEAKTLINASVLGLIFEKINGYKEGSFYTPAYITMYMCRETLRRAVVQKFKEQENDQIESFEDLISYCRKYFKVEDLKRLNEVFNQLRICDPAVGSGHFLVSALNELIVIKNELGILVDAKGLPLQCDIEIVNDELYILDNNGLLFEYKPESKESTRIQHTIFHEKQTLIENCLFGVDINPNSVKICRLRLWIELLKNAYYTKAGQLQTLPNIDINIKCGNSLISRFKLDDDLSDAFKDKKISYTFADYRNAVAEYKETNNKERKREVLNIIDQVKNNFKSTLDNKFIAKYQKAQGKLINEQERLKNLKAFGEKIAKADKDNLKKLQKKAEATYLEKEEITNNAIYRNAFEWRFEFPEVLADDGSYVGFDAVIGNPPWGASLSKSQKTYLKNRFANIDSSTPNTYAYFLGLCEELSTGLITQILPDSILVKDYAKTRELFRDSLYKISWYQNTAISDEYRPFLDVEHDVCILFISSLKNSLEATIETRNYKQGQIIEVSNALKKEDFIIPQYDSIYNLTLTKTDITIFKKLSNLDLLSFILQCHEGIHSGNIRDKLFVRDSNFYNAKPLFLGGRGGDVINNYMAKRDGWFVNYDKDIIDKSKKEYASLRDESIFSKPKIYITRTGNPFKAFLDEMTYASNNFFSIQYKDYSINTLDNLKPILGLLNSNFANYYIRRIIAPSMGDTFVETKIIHLLKLPIPVNLIENDDLKEFVSEILQKKTVKLDSNINDLQNKIDLTIYKLYGLSNDEIETIEESAK